MSRSVAANDDSYAASNAIQTDECGNASLEHELELLRSVHVTFRQAIAAAETPHPGSRTADISFDCKRDIPTFRVKTAKGQQIWDNTVDANSVAIVGPEIASQLKDLGEPERGNLEALTNVRQNVSDAGAIAERITSGKALSGGLVRRGGRLSFVVVVLRAAMT